jgi:hypothetical protein
VLFAISILLGLGVASYGFVVLQKQKTSFQWPTTSGTIVHSERVYEPSRDNSHYRADVTYSYQLNGARYMSHQISLWSADLDNYDEVNKVFVSNHQPGTAVDVYYDPKNPANAVLIPGANEKLNELLMGYGAFLAVVGTIGIIARLRKQPRLTSLLNAPDAATRTVRMKMADIEKGWNILAVHMLIGMLFMILAIGLILPPLLSGPSVLLEAPHQTNPWQFIWGIACLGGFIGSLLIGARRARIVECPICRNTLNKTTFRTHQCSRCGTRIIFEDQNLQSTPHSSKHA